MQHASSQPGLVRKLLRAGLLGSAALSVATAGFAQTPPAGDQDKNPAAAPAVGQTPAGKEQPVTVTLTAEQRQLLLQTLAQADQHGFDKAAFIPAEVPRLLGSGNKDEVVRGQELLVKGIIHYANAQHGLTAFHGDGWPKEWALRPAPYDAEKDFAFAVRQDKVKEWLDGLPPPFARYRALKAALAAARAETPAPAPAPKGKATKGAKSKTAKAPDGAPTLSREQRVATLIANMERWRWVPRNLPADRIEVNSAGDALQVFQGGKPTMAMKVAAGKPGDETPMLASNIDSIVFNPVWHIPKSIAEKEIYKKEKSNPGYFAREGIVHSESSESGLIQKPGPKNALGQIKFDFKNAFAVYLHDTPAQAAFSSASRNVSHGCVRVEKPVDLAALLLQGQPEGNPQAIQQITAGEDTKTVQVPKPMPVFLLYFTATVGPDGQVAYRKDVYDWDTMLLQLLAAGRESA